MRLRAVIFALLATSLTPGAQGAEEASPLAEAGTARDVIFRADTAYNNKRYAESAAGYRRFITDFGSSSDAQQLMPHVRYNLVAALMQLQKYDDATKAIGDAKNLRDMDAQKKEDLAFWEGVAHLQEGRHEEALKALTAFRNQFPKSARKPDAELFTGAALLMAGKFDEAARMFSSIRKAPRHPHAGRSTVLELHSLIESGKDEAALALLAEVGPDMGTKINQLATFQMLAMKLGEKLLEEDRPRDAIRALQNIWARERLVTHQKRRLEEIRKSLAALEASQRPDVIARMQNRQLLREIEKELANLEKIPSFDASVRFRLATAFQRQDRYRETAMLLDDVLRRMKPDPVVEKASLSALQSWMAVERYDKAIADAELFEQGFSTSPSLPLVLYLKGIAQQRAGKYDDAIATFGVLGEKFPNSEQGPRALFMTGFTQLLAERNEAAAETFREFQEKHPKHELSESANYWRGSALAFAKKFPEAREILSGHAEKFPKGALRAAAAFRNAYCAQSMRDYERAEAELKEFLKKFPEAEETAEARILLGDALLAQAKSDEGKKVYASLKPSVGSPYEDAQFKLAKVLKLEEDWAGQRALMQKYIETHPRSPRAAEALFQIGQTWRKEDHPEKAAEDYWKAISELGNDPQATAVEDMMLALDRHYKGESEKRDYQSKLRALRDKSREEKKDVLAVRALWALARSVKKSDPPLSEALLREAGALARPEQTSPVILADCAEAQLATAAAADKPGEVADRLAKGAQIYRDLLKWHPRAMQKDKALAALARIAFDTGNAQIAMHYYDRLENETPWSPLMGDVLSTRANMEMKSGNADKAIEAYTRLLAAENVKSKLKAGALLALGEIEMNRKSPQKAIPYYQRIYVLYGKWRDTVAQAYLRSGEAFEQLQDAEAARKTYEELAHREDLASLPQAETARERLKKFAPPADPASS